MSLGVIGMIVAVALSVLVFGLIVVGLVWVVCDTVWQRGNWGINFKQAVCTQCGTPMPPARTPANWRQALWGGWTCAECGFELDKWGRPIEGQSGPAKWKALQVVVERERRPGPREERIREVNEQTQRGDAP
jgi:hypothetical protein